MHAFEKQTAFENVTVKMKEIILTNVELNFHFKL